MTTLDQVAQAVTATDERLTALTAKLDQYAGVQDTIARQLEEAINSSSAIAHGRFAKGGGEGARTSRT